MDVRAPAPELGLEAPAKASYPGKMDQFHHTAIQVSILGQLELPQGLGIGRVRHSKGGTEGHGLGQPLGEPSPHSAHSDTRAPLCRSDFQQGSACPCAISRVILGSLAQRGPD